MHYYFAYRTTCSIIKYTSNLTGDYYHNPGSHHCCTDLPPCYLNCVFNPGHHQIEKRLAPMCVQGLFAVCSVYEVLCKDTLCL